MTGGRSIDRRAFVAVASGACATLLGCNTLTDDLTSSVDDANLTSRPAPPTEAIEPGLHSLDLGWARDGFLSVPSIYRPDVPAPLMVMLHGSGFSASEWSKGPLLGDVDDLGIVVLGVDSRGASWDYISDGVFGPDVRFIDRALAQTFRRCRIDSARVAIAGFSDGASYALSLGVANGDLASAILAFSPGFVSTPERRGSPRIFVTHGTNDPVLRVENARVIVDGLRGNGYEVVYEEFDGAHVVHRALARQAFEWFALPAPAPV